ncbi:MAG: ABC transporter ATP-binding protein [Thermoflexus sp.]
MAQGDVLLRVNNIEVRYHRVILVLKGVSLEVPPKGIVALLGANGAGKSTTLKAISGLLKHEEGQITDGSIEFMGERIDRKSAEEIAAMGIIQVLEGRRVFEHLTVEENLRVGAHQGDGRSLSERLDLVYHYFPHLKTIRNRVAGFCSGGEQQMLAIGRALMTRPKLLLLDEPSLGLAPLIVREIMEIITRLNREQGIAILLVEQNAKLALEIAQHAYVLENGRVVMEGPADVLRDNPDIKEFYLGLTELGTRKRFREAKWYKRRKRWLT